MNIVRLKTTIYEKVNKKVLSFFVFEVAIVCIFVFFNVEVTHCKVQHLVHSKKVVHSNHSEK